SWVSDLTVLLEAAGVSRPSARGLAHVILSALEGAFVLARATRRTEALLASGEAMASLVESALGRSRGSTRSAEHDRGSESETAAVVAPCGPESTQTLNQAPGRRPRT